MTGPAGNAAWPDPSRPPGMPPVPAALGGAALLGLALTLTTTLITLHFMVWDSAPSRPGHQMAFLDAASGGRSAIAAAGIGAAAYLGLVVATWARPARFTEHAPLVFMAGLPILLLHGVLVLAIIGRGFAR